MQDLQDEFAIAYLFITHNFGVVEYLADEIAVMKDGLIVEHGTAAGFQVGGRLRKGRARREGEEQREDCGDLAHGRSHFARAGA